jgi:hypothetical protein
LHKGWGNPALSFNMKSFHSFLFLITTALLSLTGTILKGEEKATPPSDFFPIYDYHNDWLVYSNQYKNYVPYSQGINESVRSVSLNIDILKNRRYFLLLRTESEGYLFLNGALQRKLQPEQWLRLNVDSLYKSFKNEELLLTIYGSAGISDKHLLLCNQKRKNTAGVVEQTASTLINIKPIQFSPFTNFAVLALLLILMLNAWIFNTNPQAFVRLINPLEYFNNNPRDQLSKINKPYSNSIIFFVIIDAMLMGFLLVFFTSNELNLFSVVNILSEQANTIQFLRDFLLLSLIFFLLMYGKFILMSVVGNMLNLDKLVDTLFLKIIQSSYFFYATLFIIIFALGFSNTSWLVPLRPYILFPFLIFYTARFISLYVVTKPSSSFINLYLFSYLCVIEIIPLIIGIKFAI